MLATERLDEEIQITPMATMTFLDMFIVMHNGIETLMSFKRNGQIRNLLVQT